MIEEAAQEERPPFDLVDFVEKNKNFFVPVIGVKLEVSIGERREVGDRYRKKPVIFEVDIEKALTGDGRNGIGGEVLDKLVNEESFAAAAGSGNGDDRSRRG